MIAIGFKYFENLLLAIIVINIVFMYCIAYMYLYCMHVAMYLLVLFCMLSLQYERMALSKYCEVNYE